MPSNISKIFELELIDFGAPDQGFHSGPSGAQADCPSCKRFEDWKVRLQNAHNAEVERRVREARQLGVIDTYEFMLGRKPTDLVREVVAGELAIERMKLAALTKETK